MKNFSYKEYIHIIDWVKTNYNIMKFSDITSSTDNFCVIRHDVEYSIDRAYRLATLEYELGIETTYLFQIRNNCYNALSVRNISLIQEIHNLGHTIGLHVHRGLLHNYDNISDLVKQDIDILSNSTNLDINIFSFHRPAIDMLLSNLKIEGLINAYGNLYFHSYKNSAPKSLRVEYISDSNHMWKYGYPLIASNSKLQLLMHPFSWTKGGYENTRNFETLIIEKNKEIISSISSEIKTFPTELL